jgi:hypothetical protein
MRSPKPYVVVTGSSGFIGAHVLRQLLRDRTDKPWDEVKAFVRSDEAAENARALGASPVRVDLLDPRDEHWQTVVAGARYLVHCAQPSTAGDYTLRAQMDVGLVRALDPRVTARAVFVYGSSYYGRTSPGQLADETMRPRRPIGLGAVFETCIAELRAAEARGLDWAGAFVGAVYGPRSWFLDAYVKALVAGEPILMCDPAPVWPYIHIDDCARAIEHLLLVDRDALASAGREVIITDDHPVPMDEFVACVARRLGKEPHFNRMAEADLRGVLPTMESSYLIESMAHSNARLRSLGFACRYPRVAEGIASLDLDPRG